MWDRNLYNFQLKSTSVVESPLQIVTVVHFMKAIHKVFLFNVTVSMRSDSANPTLSSNQQALRPPSPAMDDGHVRVQNES